ncbi:MAG: DUF1624 domain-containing protein [Clostridia bacterium]|nr:DUF1624 domain-containing protein [Clostridia bacterium]
MKKERVHALDWLRGIAVLGMILHHALFAVELTGWMFGHDITFEILQTRLFWVLQEVFVGIFLLISGICTAYSRNVLRRGLIVSGAALLITLVTGVILPAIGVTGLEIWFGILHMFGLSMLLYGLFTCKKRWVPAVTGVALFVLYLAVMERRGMPWADTLLAVIDIMPEGFYSADYYPLLPYFFLFLAGTYLGPSVKEHRFPEWFYSFRIRPIEWIGRHSLWIYLAHQPVIFGICAAIFTLL